MRKLLAAFIRRPPLLVAALALALLLLAGGGGRAAADAAPAPAAESAHPSGACKGVALRWPPWLGRLLFPALALPLLLAGPGCASEPTPTPAPETPAVSIAGGPPVPVELALTGAQRSRGLSGRESLADGRGMLFVFDRPNKTGFWMPEMRFSLDIVWIGADCRLVHIEADVPHPAPETPRSELPVYPPAVPGQYVLEVNAGDAARAGWQLGDPATFTGAGLEDTGCYQAGE